MCGGGGSEVPFQSGWGRCRAAVAALAGLAVASSLVGRRSSLRIMRSDLRTLCGTTITARGLHDAAIRWFGTQIVRRLQLCHANPPQARMHSLPTDPRTFKQNCQQLQVQGVKPRTRFALPPAPTKRRLRVECRTAEGCGRRTLPSATGIELGSLDSAGELCPSDAAAAKAA